MSRYDVWTTRDGRQVPVGDMEDLHLLHTIQAIEQRRALVVESLPPDQYLDEDEDIELDDTHRSNWLTVLRGEAIKRGLDPKQKPTRRVGLIEWLGAAQGWPAAAKSMVLKLEQHGIAQPEIDISNLDNKPSYLHWKTGANVGTPLKK